jgi:hypothetical protein
LDELFSQSPANNAIEINQSDHRIGILRCGVSESSGNGQSCFAFFRLGRKKGDVTHGGRRPGSGRKPRDTVRVVCSVPRPIYNELIRCERSTGTYGTRIAAAILTEHLIGGIVDREAARWRFATS